MNTFTKIARILPRKSKTAFLNAAVTVGRAITGVASRVEPGSAVLFDFRQTYAGPCLIDVEDFLVPAVFPTTATSTRHALGVA
jgi:hypothetical protein